MFTQITIIKIKDSTWKITFSDPKSTVYSEIITQHTDIMACLYQALEQLHADPENAYAKNS